MQTEMKSTQRKTLRELYIEHRLQALQTEIDLRHDEGDTLEELRTYAQKVFKAIQKCRFSKVVEPSVVSRMGDDWLNTKVVIYSRSKDGHYIYDLEGGKRFTTTDSITAHIYPEAFRPYCDKRDAPQPLNPFEVSNPYDY